jgi:serine/threonine-protein kinase
MIGQTIKHYKILERIGAGGMGVVYKAEDTRLGRIVALKFLPPYALDSEEDRIRFTNEAQSAAALDHPNICTIHEIGEAGEHQFIVMAYVEGPSLKERLRGDPMSPAEAVDIAAQIAAGLARAHEKNIIHRDIKPANILLSHDGLVKICDFGLAKSSISKKITRTGSTIGTAAYMSPEQARSEPVDARTDVWSLGVILYEMLAGKPPFVADHEAVVIYAILNDECPPLEERCTGLPPRLYEIVKRALAHKSKDRYASMKEFREDLLKAQADLRTQSQTVPHPVVEEVTRRHQALPKEEKPAKAPAPSEPKKRPMGMIIGVAAIVVIAVVAAFFLTRHKPAEVAVETPDTTAAAGGAAVGIAPPQAAEDVEHKTDMTVSAEKQLPTIAVLYMDNLSPDKTDDYFAAGMTEDLINTLSKLKAISVRSRFEVKPLQGQTPAIPDMGKQLHADYILEGGVQREKKQLHVTANLHRVADQELLWTMKFDRPAGDVFAVQAEVADSVAKAMTVTVAPEEQNALNAPLTTNPDAYDAFLHGRSSFERRSPDDNELAEKAFRRALSLDKNFSAAQIGLARTLLQSFNSGWDDDPKLLTEADGLIGHASPADTATADYFAARGMLLFLRDDTQGAIRMGRRAVQASPLDPEAHYTLGYDLAEAGQVDEATKELKRAIELKPDHAEAYRALGRIAMYTGKTKDATKYFSSALQLAPNADQICIAAGGLHEITGDFTGADSLYQRAIALRPKTFENKGWAGHSALLQRRLPEATALLKDACDKCTDWQFCLWLAQAYALSGKKQQADKALKDALAEADKQKSQTPDDPATLFGHLYIRTLLGQVPDPNPEFQDLAKVTTKTIDPTVRYYYTAAIYAALGQADGAMESLGRLIKLNVYAPSRIAADPAFDKIKDDPRFQKLAATPNT